MSSREIISLDFQPVDVIPEALRKNEYDLDPLFERLSSGPAAFAPPMSIGKAALDAAIRQYAERRGLSVSVRHLDGLVWVSLRAPRSEATTRKVGKMAERNNQIAEAREAGETMEAIGRRFSMSRQAVEQILIKKFSARPIGAERTEAMLKFLAPYMQYIDKRFCVVCGREAGHHKFICTPCRKLQTIIAQIKGYLTSYQNGNEQGRRQACYLIRKHRIRPEYLAPVNISKESGHPGAAESPEGGKQ